MADETLPDSALENDIRAKLRSRLQEDVGRLLDLAAEAWVCDNVEILAAQHHYSTSQNEFLWDAESAFFTAAENARADAELASQGADEEPDDRPPKDGFHLYRLWTAEHRLLYVGVSIRLRNRLAVHRRRLGDLWEVATWEEFDTAAAMLAAEVEAIATENPALNKQLVR